MPVIPRSFLMLLAVSVCCSVYSQTTWQSTYGGYGLDEGHGVRETSDHGFIVVGSTGSFGAGSSDVYVLKLDSAGNREWSVAIGGPTVDQGWSIRQLDDGGYIVAGFTLGCTGGSYDGLMIRLDGSGEVLWQKTHGGAGWDFFYDVEVLSDGFALAGTTEVNGDAQGWLVRTDLDGNIVWERNFGDGGTDEARCVRLTTDGGLVVAGTWTYTDGTSDAAIIKYGDDGDQEWSATLGGDSIEVGYSVVETSDGGYAVGGYTTSFSSNRAMLLAKVDMNGDFLWINQVAGGQGEWEGRSIRENYDGGLVLAGYTSSYGAGGYDFYMAQTDLNGSWISGPNFGGSGNELCWGMDLVSDGGYVLVGTTDGLGPGITAVYVVKNAGDVITDPFNIEFDPLVVREAVGYAPLTLSPNPVRPNGFLELGTAEFLRNGWNAELLDLNGGLVGVGQGRPGHRVLSVPGLSSGAYILRLTNPDGQMTSSKFIVQPE